MNTLSNVYNYSKDKSGIMFNYRKSKVEEEKKKEKSWIKLFHTKYEETRNTSCQYLMNLGKIIKKGSDRIWVHLSFLQFNENPKYMNFPWYKRVYFILKDQIKQFIKCGNGEVPEIFSEAQNENVNKRMEASENIETEDNTIQDKYVKYDSAVQSCYSQNSAGKLLSKYDRFFKRTNSECMNEKEDNFPAERKLLSREKLPSRYRTVSLFNGFMPFGNKFTPSAQTNDKACHVEKNEETVSINEKQDTVVVAENVSYKVSDKVSDKASDKPSDKDSDKGSDKDYETATSEPVTAESVATELVNKEPAATESVANESATTEQVATEPVTAESVATEEYMIEEISTTPGKNSDIADSNGLTDSIKKNLNIKSAWTKLSNFIA